MKKTELRSLIRECVCDALKEASYKPADDEFIEEWISMELGDEGDAVIDKTIEYVKEEWKEAAVNYPNVRAYLMDLRKNGGLEGFDSVSTSKSNVKPTQNTSNSLSKKYTKDLDELLINLIKNLQYKEQMLKVNLDRGYYLIELPDSTLSFKQLESLIKFLPKGCSLGAPRVSSKNLTIRTPFTSR